MAQEQYGFFNSTVEDERSYDSADMAGLLRTLSASGVAYSGPNLCVTAEGSTMRTLVDYGAALVDGYYYRLSNDGGGLKAIEHAPEAELSRIDRIVLRLDHSTRTVTLHKLVGTPAGYPLEPPLTRSSQIIELSLASVKVRAGASEILPSDITDEREDDAVCGLLAPYWLRRSSLTALIGDMIGDAADEIAADYTDVIRYSVQSLQTGDKRQARENILVQQSITASGLLKGDGAGGVSAAEEGTDFVGILAGKAIPERISAKIIYGSVNKTLVPSYAGCAMRLSSTADITVTIPSDATEPMPDYTEIEFIRWGTGNVTFAAETGVTLVSVGDHRSIGVQYASACLKKIAADLWLLTGYLA